MSGIEFRGPKFEKWIFEENCLTEIIRVFGNLNVFEFDGMGPYFGSGARYRSYMVFKSSL